MLQVSLLGERTVVDEATGEVRSRSSRTLALIALLATHAGSPQPRAGIASTFWPDTPEQQALTNLRRELHQLRRALDDDESLLVTATDLTWQDRETCRVDLRVFQRAREQALAAPYDEPEAILEHGGAALTALRGELLPGLYDEWTLAQRDRVVAEGVEVCGRVADAGRRTGRWAEALRAARLRVDMDPLDEVGHRELIALHAAMGDRAGAVSAYHRCASLLERELGIAPDPATRGLLADLLDSPAAAPVEPRIRTMVASVDFVGREAELGALSSAMTTAFAGSLRAALVVGEPGVGKSRLVAEAARLARRQDAVVALAHCYGVPGRLPLAPVAEWLGAPALATAARSLEAVWRAEVERLVPSVPPGSQPVASRGVVDAWQRHRFFQGLTRALLATERPLLLVLEDLQWCDDETLDFLSFLAGARADAPVMLALTGRTGELADRRGYADWVRRMRAAGVVDQLDLAPFDEPETDRLVRLLARGDVTDDAVGVVASATGGFPLYVVEAARNGRLDDRADTTDLASVLQARFEHLGAEARAVAELAAATGRDFDLDLLCEASDLDPGTVVRAVDELWRVRIVTERRDGYDFSHDLLRSAAYARVSPPGRWLLHRRLAQALEILHAGRTDDVAAQIAEQYARAGNPVRAHEHYHRAAEVAARVFAHTEAIRLHEAALQQLALQPPGLERDLREIRGLTAMSASLNAVRGYSDPQLAASLERVASLAERHARRDTLVEALVALWASRFVQGDIATAHGLATRAALLIGSESQATDDALAGQVHFALGGSGLSLGMLATGAHHFDLAGRYSTDEQSIIIGSHFAIHAHGWSAHAHWLLGEHARAASVATEAVERARLVHHPYSLAIALAYAAVTWQLLDDRDRLQEAADELGALSSRHGFAYYPEWGRILGGWAADDARGTARMERGLARLKASGAFSRMPYWLSLLAQRTGPDRTRAVLDAAVASAVGRDDRWWLPELLRQRAALVDGPESAATLREALEVAEEQGSVTLAERCRHDLDTRRTIAERTRS